MAVVSRGVQTVWDRGAIGGLRPRKLPARAQSIVFPLLLSLLMSGVVSAITTLKALGLADGILPRILEAWAMSYVIAFPTALLAIPVVRRIVGLLVQTTGPQS
ncbi:MAG TPA: DUF2798 domain-containing protein [Alphaproteobacteria bacterium]|nr:DUF2798 domain-containing protein [Alphaproteobacteria bacterium]